MYSNCPTVELFVNGVSIGKQTQAQIAEKYQFRWWTTFHPGTVTAKGYDADGAVVATDEVKTSDGIPARLALTAYKTTVDVTTDDLVFVTCEVQDKDGVPVPTASSAVTFTCTGGTVLGTDNGNAACVEPMRTNTKSAFSGKVLCVPTRWTGGCADCDCNGERTVCWSNNNKEGVEMIRQYSLKRDGDREVADRRFYYGFWSSSRRR